MHFNIQSDEKTTLPIMWCIVPYGPLENPPGHTFTLREQDGHSTYIGDKIK